MQRFIILESIIIGISTVVVGFISTRILSFNKFPKLEDKNLTIMLVNFFVIGVSLHLIYEYSGLNAKFCEYI